jgi:hypothetical protein
MNTIELASDRARIELDLLLNLTGGVRQGLAILSDLGITAEHFAEDDCRAIFIAIRYGVDRDTTERAKLCRSALRHLHLWDDNDLRDFVGGMRWGPGPLAALFYRLPFRRERLALHACRLIEHIELQQQVAVRLRGAA